MDKKNTIIGALLLLAPSAACTSASGSRPRARRWSSLRPARPRPPRRPRIPPAAGHAGRRHLRRRVQGRRQCTTTTLANDFIEVRLTDQGGAIRDVALRKHLAELGSPAPYVFNQVHADPILAFTDDALPGLGRTTRYQLVSATPAEVV